MARAVFDDPTSLALKAQLANSYHIAGVGIWALGMDGNNPAMLAALLGNAPAAKSYQTGPTTTSTSSTTTTVSGPPGSGFKTTGSWSGHPVTLTPVNAPSLPATRQKLGTLSTFSTDDPDLSCLETTPHLTVWSYASMPHVDVVLATQPQDCASAAWTIPTSTSTVTKGTSGSSTSTTSAPTPTSTYASTPPIIDDIDLDHHHIDNHHLHHGSDLDDHHHVNHGPGSVRTASSRSGIDSSRFCIRYSASPSQPMSQLSERPAQARRRLFGCSSGACIE